MIQEIAEALAQSWHNFATAFVLFVPRLVAATIIFVGGFVVAVIARRIVQALLSWLRFDRLALRTGASEMLRIADMPSAELLIGKIVFPILKTARASDSVAECFHDVSCSGVWAAD